MGALLSHSGLSAAAIALGRGAGLAGADLRLEQSLSDMELFDDLLIELTTAPPADDLLFSLIEAAVAHRRRDRRYLPGIRPSPAIRACSCPPPSACRRPCTMIVLAGIYLRRESGGRPRPSSSTSPAKPHRSSPASTATRWRGRAAPEPRAGDRRDRFVRRRNGRDASIIASAQAAAAALALKFGPSNILAWWCSA